MRDIMLILHLIGVAMGIGTSFAHAFLGKAISKMDKSEAKKFGHQLKGLSQMGYVGILLLLISGIYLIVPFWAAITTLPLLILKLVLVFILIVLILFINRGAKKDYINDTEEHTKGIEIMGKIALIIGVSIVIIAVNVFH